MLILLRVALPDRPGALGQVASRIGAVRGDVLGIEILGSEHGRVVDEFVVGIEDLGLLDLLITEVSAVDDADIIGLSVLDRDRHDPDRTALEAAVELLSVEPDQRWAKLCEVACSLADGVWAAVVLDGGVRDSAGLLPDPLPAGHSDGPLLWLDLAHPGGAFGVGRAEREFHERERSRLELLLRLIEAAGPPQ
jgi:hypothetical protein